jgi:YD repeat-containing protein
VASYTYDANGNLTGKTADGHVWAYEWNAENQLLRVTKDGTEVARFAYDPVGRRVEKIAGGVTTTYAYDNEDILRQSAAGTSVRYVHELGIDEPLSVESQTGQLTFEHADALGSELKQTDSTGAVTFDHSYDAFGQLQSGISSSGYAFTGREWDAQARLYYYRARYYEPEGRAIPERRPAIRGRPNPGRVDGLRVRGEQPYQLHRPRGLREGPEQVGQADPVQAREGRLPATKALHAG